MNQSDQFHIWSWATNWTWAIVCVVFVVAYLYGVVRLARRQVRWPVSRTLLWLFGWASIAVMTATGFQEGGGVSFGVHMLQHMGLSMISPAFLTAAAPMTLLLRTLPSGRGPRAAPRRAIVKMLHWPIVKFISSPGYASVVFYASLYGLYLTPLFDAMMTSHVWHQVMLVHFLAVGLLFFGGIISIDPWPNRKSHAVRLFQLIATMPIHAFFGVILMMSSHPTSNVLAASMQSLGIDPMVDQAWGAGIAWSIGEIPAVIIVGIVFADWYRHDKIEAARIDRELDRQEAAEAAEAAANQRFLDTPWGAASGR